MGSIHSLKFLSEAPSSSKSKLQHHSSTTSCLSLSPFGLPANQGAGDWRARAGSRGLISNCSWRELVVARVRNRWRGNSWYSDSLNIGPRLVLNERAVPGGHPPSAYIPTIWKETPQTLRIFLATLVALHLTPVSKRVSQ